MVNLPNEHDHFAVDSGNVCRRNGAAAWTPVQLPLVRVAGCSLRRGGGGGRVTLVSTVAAVVNGVVDAVGLADVDWPRVRRRFAKRFVPRTATAARQWAGAAWGEALFGSGTAGWLVHPKSLHERSRPHKPPLPVAHVALIGRPDRRRSTKPLTPLTVFTPLSYRYLVGAEEKEGC